MKITDAFPKTWDQAEADRQATERATAPTRDTRTGELIPHCVGHRHRWVAAGAYALRCLRCPAVKVRDR